MKKARICKNCIYYDSKRRSSYQHFGEGYCLRGKFWTGNSEYMFKDCIRLPKEKKR